MYLLPRDVIRTRSGELLAVLDLSGEDKKLTLEFSHGMKKKLALRGLAAEPDLLSSTSRSRRRRGHFAVIRDLLSVSWPAARPFPDLARSGNCRKLCTHVGMIVKGALVEQGSLKRSVRRLAGDASCAAAPMRRRHKISWLEEAPRELAAFQDISLAALALSVNQGRRSGVVNAVLFAFAAILVVLGSLALCVIVYFVATSQTRNASPAVLMLVWTVSSSRFLLLHDRLITELQRSEALSLEKFLHLPVSPTGRSSSTM